MGLGEKQSRAGAEDSSLVHAFAGRGARRVLSLVDVK